MVGTAGKTSWLEHTSSEVWKTLLMWTSGHFIQVSFYSWRRGGAQNNGSPKDVHVLIPRACDDVRLQDKGAFWVLISWRSTRGVTLDCQSGLSRVTRVLKSGKGRQEAQAEWCPVRTLLAIFGFQDGGRGHEPRNESSLWELEKARTHCPREPPGGNTALLTPWFLSQWPPKLPNNKLVLF